MYPQPQLRGRRNLHDEESWRGRHRRGGPEFGPHIGGPGHPEVHPLSNWMRGWRSGHGPQAGRGDVRAALLALLAEKPLHGYQLIQEIEQRSGGAWRPSPGSIYPALQLLEDEGLIQSQEADGRRVYQLTDAGKAAVASHHDALAELWQSRRGPRPTAMRELHEMVHHLVAAVSQVARAGSDAEIAQAKEVLVQARKQLYRLLAEGGPTAEPTPPAPKAPPAPTPGSTTL